MPKVADVGAYLPNLRVLRVGGAAHVDEASARLDAALSALHGEHHAPFAEGDGALAIRVEVDLPAAVVDPLGWLAAVEGPGVAFASRDGLLRVAGRGEAWAVRGEQTHLERGVAAAARLLQGAGRRARAFGGMRYRADGAGPPADARWRRFADFRFALPAVELGVDAEGAWLAAAVVAPAAQVDVAVEGTRALLAIPSARPPPSQPPAALSRRDVPNRADFLSAVRAAVEAIGGADGVAAGAASDRSAPSGAQVPSSIASGLAKVVLARRSDLRFAAPLDAVALLEALAVREAQSYRFCLRPEAELAFLGASPERLYRRDGVWLVSEALAGTSARDADAATDEALGLQLLTQAKERQEHALVVDGVRAALLDRCDALEAAPQPTLLRQSRVQHLWTPVRGRLRAAAASPLSADAALLRALHPTPAVGGSPRSHALAFQAREEGFDRGWYAGPVGYLGDDCAEFCVGIRAALVAGAEASLYAGAGVVGASVPDDEWREVERKLGALLAALGVGAGATVDDTAGLD